MTHLLHYTTQGCNLSDFARSACRANLDSDGYISTLAHINGVTTATRQQDCALKHAFASQEVRNLIWANRA